MKYIITLIFLLATSFLFATTSLAGSRALIVSIVSIPDAIGTGTVVSFVGQSDIVSSYYQWDMGDGTPIVAGGPAIGGKISVVQHVFSEVGAYTITLTVKSKDGTSSTRATKTITVGAKRTVSGEMSIVTSDKKVLTKIAKVALVKQKAALMIEKENTLITKYQTQISIAEVAIKTQAKSRTETSTLLMQIQDYKDKIAKGKIEITKLELKAKKAEQTLNSTKK